MSDWELHANAGWRKGEWMAIEDSVCEKLAQILGADKQDVGITASLTIGLHGLLSTFYKPDNKRNKIVMLVSEFTSDILAS